MAKKTITFTVEFDDENGYKGHGEDTYELIECACKTEIEIGLEHDGVIKEGWKLMVISKT